MLFKFLEDNLLTVLSSESRLLLSTISNLSLLATSINNSKFFDNPVTPCINVNRPAILPNAYIKC